MDRRREDAGRERVVLARGLDCCDDEALAESEDCVTVDDWD